MSEAFQAFRISDFGVTPASDERPSAAARGRSNRIVVERAEAKRLASIGAAWRDLVGRALEPNVFMDPGVLLAAMAAAPNRKFVILLAWDSNHADARLVGVWGTETTRALLPLRVLRAPAGPHGFLATPVLDRQLAEPVLHAMLDAIAAAPDLPNILSATPIRADGATMPILRHVMPARRAERHIFALWQRPLLQSDMDGGAYLAVAMSSSSRKKLRQHRRRLAERGVLSSHTYLSAPDVCAAFEQFLVLEAAGWKGRRGDALNCSPSDAAFARDMMATLSARGDARIYALCLDERPVCMQIVLRSGAAAFTWKTAYDENLHDVSPGILLLEDYTKALLADSAIAFVDSCAFDETSFMSVWRERETLAHIWIDARRGGSLGFSTCAWMQGVLLRLRSHVKQLYKTGIRTWKKFKR